MLTGEQIEEILNRSGESFPDICTLAREINRLANQLSDCWLVLDSIARGINLRAMFPDATGAAAKLLRKQQAPGWKE